MSTLIRYFALALILNIYACSSPDDATQSNVVSLDPANEYGKELIAWWKFDEREGQIALDASRHQNTASILNGKWEEGISGAALFMDGGNDSIVTVPVTDSLKSTADAITLTAWVYRTAQHNVDVVGHTYPYFFFGYHGSQFKFQLGSRTGKFAKCYAPKKYVAKLNEWQHLAGTYDGEMVRLYYNGTLICAAPLTGKIVLTADPFTLSGYRNREQKIVDEITGKIDDVRIYNYALKPEEIINIMNLNGPAQSNSD
jgi:hypothetical protein